MSVEVFETWSLYLGIGGLMCFMGFIVWDLARQSGAGRLGTFVLFTALGMGLMGFLVKTVMVEVLQN